MEIIIAWIVFSFLVGAFWQSKGKGFGSGFVVSLLLSPLVGFIIGLVLKPDIAKEEEDQIQSGTMKKCPYCAELIKREAIVCRYCGRDLPASLDDKKESKEVVGEEASDTESEKQKSEVEEVTSKIYCPYCGKQTETKKQICQECGKNVSKLFEDSEYECRSCKKNASEDALYCWHCGEKFE